MTFSQVTHAGDTTAAVSDTGPAPPEGFQLGTDPPTYFDIDTTAGYIPPMEVCIDYSAMNVTNENALTLMHWDGTQSQWVDVTTSLDTVNHIICGNVTSLSDFALMVPTSMQSFVIKNLTILWAPHLPRMQGSDLFGIFGRLQLPRGYTVADLQKQATVSITITGKSGNDTVILKGQLLGRPQSTFWSYNGSEQPPGEDMNITNMAIWWATQGTKWAGWAGFYVGGKLQLPQDIGVNIKPSDVKVTVEIPITVAAGSGSLMGKQTVTCSVFKLLDLWFYNSLPPNLPTFPYDPTGN